MQRQWSHCKPAQIGKFWKHQKKDLCNLWNFYTNQVITFNFNHLWILINKIDVDKLFCAETSQISISMAILSPSITLNNKAQHGAIYVCNSEGRTCDCWCFRFSFHPSSDRRLLWALGTAREQKAHSWSYLLIKTVSFSCHVMTGGLVPLINTNINIDQPQATHTAYLSCYLSQCTKWQPDLPIKKDPRDSLI